MAKAGEPFAALTCYDATTARWLARGGVHVLLVGDTAAEVVLGLPRTIDMPLDVLIALTAGVKRGAPNCVVMADMPFMSYQSDDATAIRNAGRFLTEGLADIVKIEADARLADRIAKVVHAGVPVCAHVGSRPQYVALTGGYTAAGRTPDTARQVVEDAVACERAGAQMLLIEAVPHEVTEQVLARTTIPIIGIGAGPACHGQVLVIQDLVGMTDRPPRFAEPVADIGRSFQAAAAEWVSRVARRQIGGQPYRMKPPSGPAPGTSAGTPSDTPMRDGNRSAARPGDRHAAVPEVPGTT
jgi:3-methyl-2-oxobutanoate hydroxymethyltransferase